MCKLPGLEVLITAHASNRASNVPAELTGECEPISSVSVSGFDGSQVLRALSEGCVEKKATLFVKSQYEVRRFGGSEVRRFGGSQGECQEFRV